MAALFGGDSAGSASERSSGDDQVHGELVRELPVAGAERVQGPRRDRGAGEAQSGPVEGGPDARDGRGVAASVEASAGWGWHSAHRRVPPRLEGKARGRG